MLLRLLCFIGLLAFGAISVQANDAPELRPYQVQLRVTFEAHPALSPMGQQAVVAEMAETGQRCLGEMWQTEILLEPPLAGDLPAGLERRMAAAAQSLAAKYDKLFSLVVSVESEGFRVAGLEWDAATQQSGLPTTAYAASREELATALWQVTQQAFRPVAVIAGGGGNVGLLARAGELPPPDADWTPQQSGRMWEPFYRFYGPDLKLKKIQPVPWTFVLVDKLMRSYGQGKVLSGLRDPLTRRRQRTDVVALAVAPHGFATELRLVSGPKPQAGVEIDVYFDLKTPLRLISDRHGSATVGRDPTHPHPWIHIRSGQEILAKLPMVPGLHAVDILELPDDSLRLRVEGEVAFLQAELMDAVARRATLMATARKRLKAKQWTEVSDAIKQVREIRKIEEFAVQLEAIRINGVESAKVARDRAAEARIKQLCVDAKELIAVYLDPDKVRQLEEELNELRKISEENAKAEAEAKAK